MEEKKGVVRRALYVSGCLLGLGSLVVDCGLFGSVQAPIADCGNAVLQDAAKGMTIEQILVAVAPQCALDAADIAVLLLASKDPSIVASKAAGQAVSMRAKLTRTVVP